MKSYIATMFLAALALLSNMMLAAAAPLAARDVFVPPILYPHAGTVWKIGNHHNVTWDTSNAPKQITNGEGMIVLAKGGRLFSTGPGSLATPLASNFSILLGRIVVQVPNVTPASDYQLVLFGDSGNFSPNFTITH